MPPKKLSDSDKQEILNQYRDSDQTTVTLAAQYGVSTSTISRFLKQSLAEPEYEALVQRKRSGGRLPAEQDLLPGLAFSIGAEDSAEFADLENSGATDSDFDPFDELPALDRPQRRQRKRTASGFISAEQLAASVAHLSQLEQAPLTKSPRGERLADLEADLESDLGSDLEVDRFELEDFKHSGKADELEDDELEDDDLESEDLDEGSELEARPSISLKSALPAPKLARPLPVPKTAVAFEEPEDEDDLDDLDDDDLGDLDDDDLDDDFDESDSLSSLDSMQLQPAGQLQILPLQETALPRTCYVVVDRASELITRPLKDFAELGQIRSQETQEKTLPIFDNHRVAKRFLRRMQRIVKVPDGRVFQKVKPYLQAKGITHLLIDGQIYSLN